MATFRMSLSSATPTGTYVQDGHFGTNALHDINVSATGDMTPHPGFADAIDALDLTHLRYPGGHVENTLDVTRLENGQLRGEVRAFMDWCVANSTPEAMIEVTFVLPTKVDIPSPQIEAFVYLLLEQYGDYISGLEIGNEYSIGRRIDNPDRSTHPEDNPDSDFVSSMTENEYGIAANRVINAAQDAIDQLATDRPDLGYDPALLLQLADTNGSGSAYKGNGNWDQANEAILSWLDQRALDSIDGAVAHYYYNKAHEDSLGFTGEYQELRSIDQRIENFNAHLGRDVPLFITEWNVLNSNHNQLGMASASTLIEMFEIMVQMDTDDAFIWPLQHRTANTIAGNRDADSMDLTAGGGAFQMMSETLRTVTSAETGQTTAMQSIQTDWSGSIGGEVEINYFANPYLDVLYVSLRDLDIGSVTVDLQPFLAEAVSVDVTRLTMDPTTSDGLSDHANDDGLSRIGRREITEQERTALEQLGFFEPDNKNHIQVTSGGQARTYLPNVEGILAMVPNPQAMGDYYFVTETDVGVQLIDVAGDFLRAGQVSLDMMPYDIAQIVIEKKWVQEGSTADERFVGGYGQDVVLARGGNDRITTGEGCDTLKGGFGNDHLNAGSGDDSIHTGQGDDTVLAGAGDDLIVVETGTKVIDGGAGKDTLQLELARSAYTGTYENGQLRLQADGFDAIIDNVETLGFDGQTITVTDYLNEIGGAPGGQYGTALDDRLNGTGSGEVLSGNAGSDILIGQSGRDTLRGGAGEDLLIAEDRGLYFTEESAQVYRIYQAVFGRQPDVNGHQHWLTQIASGSVTLDDAAGLFVSSAEFQQSYGNTSNAQFVTLLYQNVFARTPDQGGLDSWVAQLDQGMSRQKVVLHFAESREHRSVTAAEQTAFDMTYDATEWSDDVYRLFRAIFDREPDPGGFSVWVESLSKGTPLGEVVGAFMNSPEFQATYGAASNTDFVTLLYQNVLKRLPDPGGMTAWTTALEGGTARADIVAAFMGSPEFVTTTQADLIAFMRSAGLDDVLEAGSGDSLLSGGIYADTFVFDADEDGNHYVTDLEAWDIIQLSDFGYADADTARSHMSQHGDDVLFTDQGVSVVFADFVLNQITDDMLSFG
jgi:Ca2+-binding RTX toxin-like protein